MNFSHRERDEHYVAAALASAREKILSIEEPAPTGAEIVFATMQTVADTQHRMPGRVGPARYRTHWTAYLHTADEIADAEKQARVDALAGDATKPRNPPTSNEISTMDAVYELFRPCVVTSKSIQDWKMLNDLAAPKATLRSVGNHFGVNKDTVRKRSNRACEIIWEKLRHLMPAAARPVDLQQAA